MKKIAIASDPNASEYKKIIMEDIKAHGFQCDDLGSDDSIYANVAIKLAEDVVSKKYDKGIILCGTGIGVAIAANKVKGAYAATVTDAYQAERAVKSNNANIMTLGAQVTGIESAKLFARIFLKAEYDPNSRSAPKVQRICDYESKTL